MSNVTFDKVVEEVRALSPEEQRRLRELLDTWLTKPHFQPTEDEFEQYLFELGLLSETIPSITDLAPYQNRKPFELKGKPISEVIIEERR